MDEEVRLNRAGQIVAQCWLEIPRHFPQVELDAFVVMPNYVHGIIAIVDDPNGARARHVVPLPDTSHAGSILPEAKAELCGRVGRLKGEEAPRRGRSHPSGGAR